MSNNQDKLKRFQVIKTNASAVGDNTKPTRFAITIEVDHEKESTLVAKQFTLTDKEGKPTNAMNRAKKGYVVKLNAPNKKNKIGVGIDLFEINNSEIINKSKIYTGKNKRKIMNAIYNKKDKKTNYQVNIVKNNIIKRKRYKNKKH